MPEIKKFNLPEAGMRMTKEFEGFSPNVYEDVPGQRAVGYGFSLNDSVVRQLLPDEVRKEDRPLTVKEADEIFPALYERARQDAIKYIGEQKFNDLDDEKQNILTDMAYNLGLPRLSGFKKMRAAILKSDFDEASSELVRSKWFNDVGRRGEHHAQRMKGIPPPDAPRRNRQVENAVSRQQERLKALGFDPGEIDGVYGPKTKEAVQKFQQSRDLKQDGIIGENTIKALFEGAKALNPFQVKEAAADEIGNSNFDNAYAQYSRKYGINPNPDDPRHFYDYRKLYEETGSIQPDESGHLPSKYKLPGHPRTFVNGINTITGEPARNQFSDEDKAMIPENPRPGENIFGLPQEDPEDDPNTSQLLQNFADEQVKKKVDDHLQKMAEETLARGGVSQDFTRKVDAVTTGLEKALIVDKGIMSFVASTPSALGGLVREFGEKMEENPSFWEFALNPIRGLSQNLSAELAKNIEFDERIRDSGINLTEANQRFLESKNLTGQEYQGIDRVLFDLGSGVGSMGAAIGVAVVANSPYAGGALYDALQRGNLYNEARSKGVAVKESSIRAAIGGHLEGSLEGLGLNFLLKRYGGRIANIMIRSGEEFLQEFSQQIAEDTVADWRNVKGPEMIKRAGYAGLIGFMVGGPTSVALDIMERNGVIQEFEDMGLSVEQAKRAATELLIAQRRGLSDLINEKIMPDIMTTLASESGEVGPSEKPEQTPEQPQPEIVPDPKDPEKFLLKQGDKVLVRDENKERLEKMRDDLIKQDEAQAAEVTPPTPKEILQQSKDRKTGLTNLAVEFAEQNKDRKEEAIAALEKTRDEAKARADEIKAKETTTDAEDQEGFDLGQTQQFYNEAIQTLKGEIDPDNIAKLKKKLKGEEGFVTNEEASLLNQYSKKEDPSPEKERFINQLPNNERTEEAEKEFDKIKNDDESAVAPPEEPPVNPPTAEATDPEEERPKSSKEKRQIEKSTGVKKLVDNIVQREDVALRQKIRSEARGAKAGFAAGKRLIREQNKIKNQTNRYVRAILALSERNMDPEYKEQIDDILGKLDLKRRAAKTLKRRESMRQFVERQRLSGEEIYIPPEQLDLLDRTSLNDITLEKLKDIYDTIKQIAHLGINKQKLLFRKQERDLNEVAERIVGRVVETTQADLDIPDKVLTITERRRLDKKGKVKTPFSLLVEPIKSGLSKFYSSLRKVEFVSRTLDGFKGGPTQEFIIQPIQDAASNYATKIAEIYGKLRESARPISKDLKSIVRDIHSVEGVQLTKAEAMAVYANSKSPINYEMGLIRGYNWSPQLVDKIIGILSEKEKKFVDDMMTLVQSLHPETKRVGQRLTGKRVGEREGYWPKVTDKELSDLAVLREAEKDLFQSVMKVTFVERGFIKDIGRVPEPVSLDFFGVLFNHINKVTHFNTHVLAVRDVQKTLNHPKVRQAIKQSMGDDIFSEYQLWLREVANPKSVPVNNFDKWVGYLKRNTTSFVLGMKVSVSLKQFGSITQTINEIGLKDTAKGLKEFYSNPFKATKFIYENSPQMKFREQTFDREVKEWIQSANARQILKGDKSLEHMFYWMIKTVDKMATLPSWLAAYNKNFEATGDHLASVNFADGVARRTQPSGSAKDIAGIMRGPNIQKIFTMFYTHFSNTFNQLADITDRIKFGKDDPFIKARDALVSLFWVLLAPTFYASVVTKHRLPTKEEFAKEVISYGSASVPLVRDIVSGILNPRFEVEVSPVFGLPTSLVKIATSNRTQTKLKNVSNVIGYFTGLPTSQAWVTTTGLMDLLNGKTSDLRRLIMSEFQLGTGGQREVPALPRFNSRNRRSFRKSSRLRRRAGALR